MMPTARSLFRNALTTRWSSFAQAASASLLANLLALGAALYSMQVYDRVIPTQGVSTLIVLTVGVFIATVLELIAKLARSHVLESAVKDMDLELSHAIFQRLVGIRLDQFPPSVGTLSGQLRSYETIRNFLTSATLYLAVDAPFALLFLCVIALIAGTQIAFIPLVFFVLAISLGLLFHKRIAHHAATGNIAANQKLGLLVETVENAESIKATGTGARQLGRWDALNCQSVEDDIIIRRHNEQSTYWAAFMQQISYILLVAMGAWVAATSTDLTMGGLIACSILSGRVLAPVGALPGLIVQWAHARAALDSLEKVFVLKGDNHGIDQALNPEHLHGEYKVEDLRFGWPPLDERPPVITLNRLHIKAGEKVGIIGPIGAGKSTLLRLLAGLYAPTQGRVLLDDLDIRHIARERLSTGMGYLPQDVKLLSGTLRDNLSAGLADLTEADLINACKATGLITLVSAHPRGLELPIGEGGIGVSGGQRQLIVLTRLLLSKPEIWLLDEPTAAMDEVTEQRSLAVLRNAIAPAQTLILVTHKPVLIGLVDRLIVLGPGGILMDGPRDAVIDLLKKKS